MLVRGEAKSSLSRIGLDEAIAQGLLDDLDSSGVRVLTNTSADVFDVPEALDQPLTIGLKSNAKDAANAEPPADLECDLFLAAMGRRPTVCDGLAEIGGVVDPKGGAVRVSASFAVEGAPPTVYAAGDLIGAPALASTGVEQAKAAVSAMFAESEADRASVGRDNFPVGVWTIPEIGYYGLTKAAALKQGLQAEEGVAPYTSCLRGRVFAPQGFLKLVFDRSDGRVVGVHILGTDACELIHYGMELINGKRTIFDVMSTLFTAVTFHELFKAAAVRSYRSQPDTALGQSSLRTPCYSLRIRMLPCPLPYEGCPLLPLATRMRSHDFWALVAAPLDISSMPAADAQSARVEPRLCAARCKLKARVRGPVARHTQGARRLVPP